MKNLILVLTVLFAVISLNSCSKEESDGAYFSKEQLTALNTFKGTFRYTIMNIETTIQFVEQYNPPLSVVIDGRVEEYIHGMYRVIYYDGSSYNRYYHIGFDGDWMSSSVSTDWKSVHVVDLNVIDENTFRIKEQRDVLWDTYNRIN